jgi:hypothetical protein
LLPDRFKAYWPALIRFSPGYSITDYIDPQTGSPIRANWMGKLVHGGPWGFFHGYARYRDFSLVLPLSDRLDAVVRTAEPGPALHAVFGRGSAEKPLWPQNR